MSTPESFDTERQANLEVIPDDLKLALTLIARLSIEMDKAATVIQRISKRPESKVFGSSELTDDAKSKITGIQVQRETLRIESEAMAKFLPIIFSGLGKEYWIEQISKVKDELLQGASSSSNEEEQRAESIRMQTPRN
jgi:hypothetical protein